MVPFVRVPGSRDQPGRDGFVVDQPRSRFAGVEPDVDDAHGARALGAPPEQQPRLERHQRDRVLGVEGTSQFSAGQPVDAGGNVDGDDRGDAWVRCFEVAVEADAEQSVEGQVSVWEPRGHVGELD